MKYKLKQKLLVFLILIISSLIFVSNSHLQTKIKTAYYDTVSIFNGKSLKGWEFTDFEGHGKIYVKEKSIIIEKGETCSGIRWIKEIPKLNYEIALETKRIDGNDFFCGLTFPVNNEYCTLIIGGWGGSVVGLSCIDELDASENETGTMKTFKNGQWYQIRLRVSEKSIQAWINEKKSVDFKRSGQKLSLRWEVEPSKPLGIATWKTTAALRNLKLVKLK